MSFCRLVPLTIVAALASGCINSSTFVRVKPDGSGTVEQTLLVNGQSFKGLMAGMGGSGTVKESGGVLTDEQFKRSAERMGVRPVSLTPMKEGLFEGTRALYAFDDISKIRVDQDPQMGGGASAVPSGPASSPIRFSFDKQATGSVLTIAFDEKAVSSASAKAPEAAPIDPAIIQMVKGVFQGFKVGIDLEVEGTIVKTNADYVSGSRITLLQIDLNALLEDEAVLGELQRKFRPGATIAEMKPLLKDVKGVKINHPTVTIEYR